MIDANVLGSAIMCMNSYPHSKDIIMHGVRALEWIIHAGKSDVWRLMVDEGVRDIIVQALAEYNDADVVTYTSSLLTQLVKAMSVSSSLPSPLDPALVASFVLNSTLLSTVKDSMLRNAANESVLGALAMILAVLVANSGGGFSRSRVEELAAALIQNDFCRVLLMSLQHAQLPANVRLITGVLWKCCLDRWRGVASSLVEDGRAAFYQASGIDGVIEVLQHYPNDVVLQRNCCGCLLLMTRDCGCGDGASPADPSVGSVMMSRLAVSLVMDALQDCPRESQLAIQAIPLLQAVCVKSGETDCC